MRSGAGYSSVELASLVRHIAQDRTVRLVSSARLRDPVLLKLVAEDELDALAEIEGATSSRVRTQVVGADHLDRRELVFGIPHAHFINAAFAYWLPRSLSRFNGPGRGAWYAALTVETCIAEVTFHIERELANVVEFNAVVEYAEMFASFVGDFVDVRDVTPRPDYLDPNPAKGYPAGNRLANAVRAAGHYGIVYPSVRSSGGTCFVALVPHAVQSVAQGKVIRLSWKGTPGPEIGEIAS
ncbi:MAG: RES domain-containing protein [Rhodospirillales bacterium]|nr:RES domain-containing protein [Rhodospirillales bacterium]